VQDQEGIAPLGGSWNQCKVSGWIMEPVQGQWVDQGTSARSVGGSWNECKVSGWIREPVQGQWVDQGASARSRGGSGIRGMGKKVLNQWVNG